MRLRVSATLLLFGGVILGGCPSPSGEFDDFIARQAQIDLSVQQPDLPPSMIFDITGRFLMAVSTTLAPASPLQLIVTSTLTPNGDGTATLEFQAQALTVADRMPVGNAVDSGALQVAPDGTFIAPLGSVTIPGAANPIILGADIVAMLTLNGTIRSADRFCGDVTGMVTLPIALDLAGSKWGAIRVPPGAIGAALPAPDATCPAGGAPDLGVDDMSQTD